MLPLLLPAGALDDGFEATLLSVLLLLRPASAVSLPRLLVLPLEVLPSSRSTRLLCVLFGCGMPGGNRPSLRKRALMTHGSCGMT